MSYKVIHEPSFNAAQAEISPKMDPLYLSDIKWALEHDPHAVGTKISNNVWLTKVVWAPIVASIYYAINETKQTVYLLDLTT